GIAAEELDKIFDAFHSTKGHGGTGLGLPAAEKIVREMGGQIEVRSTTGEGTTFTIHLPIRTVQLAEADKTLTPGR
ncbi:MAG: sensor histidine kinase, partial [bacterium]|nr:sensor histidine kinase [bacterium]